MAIQVASMKQGKELSEQQEQVRKEKIQHLLNPNIPEELKDPLNFLKNVKKSMSMINQSNETAKKAQEIEKRDELIGNEKLKKTPSQMSKTNRSSVNNKQVKTKSKSGREVVNFTTSTTSSKY